MYLEWELEKALRDPEKRIKLYIAFNVGIMLVNIAIAVGLGVLFLRFLRVV
jgi:hypothetical protein